MLKWTFLSINLSHWLLFSENRFLEMKLQDQSYGHFLRYWYAFQSPFHKKIPQFRQILAMYKINNLFLFVFFFIHACRSQFTPEPRWFIHLYLLSRSAPDSCCLQTSPLEYLKGPLIELPTGVPISQSSSVIRDFGGYLSHLPLFHTPLPFYHLNFYCRYIDEHHIITSSMVSKHQICSHWILIMSWKCE